MGNTIQYYRERKGSLKQERESFMPHWREISENIAPRLSRFLVEDRNRGDKRNQKIYNESATIALRTLRSGMVTGVTNPSVPWAVMRTPDPDLNKYKPVKMFLDELRNRMMEILLRSNYYTTLPMVYGDQALYAQSAFFAPQDPESIIRTYAFPIGSYYLAKDHRGRTNTCYRDFAMTAGQMLARFGKDKISRAALSLAQQNAGKEQWINVVHAIEQNPDYDPKKSRFSYYKKFHSCIYEEGADKEVKLHESGYDMFPVIAPAWDVVGEDVYGTSCPGMEALSAIKELHLREKRKGQLIDKAVSPPMKAPASLKNRRSSILSGDITYLEQTPNGSDFAPVYLPDPTHYQWVLQDIQRLEGRISRIFFEDLFLMMANDQRSNITAREIAERHEEKLLQLGPVLMRQNDEHFDLLFDLLFSYMVANNILPPIPKELSKMDLVVEYVSILSQSMKMVGLGGIERSVGFVGQMLAAWPEVRHSINPYNAVSEYFIAAGVSPNILQDRVEYDQALEAEAEAQQQAQQMQQMMAAKEMIPAAAKTVKDLAGADMEGDNALTRMSDMMGEAA